MPPLQLRNTISTPSSRKAKATPTELHAQLAAGAMHYLARMGLPNGGRIKARLDLLCFGQTGVGLSTLPNIMSMSRRGLLSAMVDRAGSQRHLIKPNGSTTQSLSVFLIQFASQCEGAGPRWHVSHMSQRCFIKTKSITGSAAKSQVSTGPAGPRALT